MCVQKKEKRKIMLIVSRSERRGKRGERERRRKINFGLMELETERERGGISELASHGLELTAATRTRIFIAFCSARDFQISTSNEVTDGSSSKIDVYCQVIALSTRSHTLSLVYFNGSERN